MTLRRCRLRSLGLGAVVAVWLVVGSLSPADATWSIIAVDPETGLVGAAMASCVPAEVLGNPGETLVPVVLVPGRAAAVAQATIDPQAPGRLRQLLVDGATPAQAIEELVAEDEQASVRQYGVVVVPGTNGRPGSPPDGGPDDPGRALATTTGDDVEGPAGAVAGELVSVQGVLLASEEVIERSLAAYQAARASGAAIDQALVDGLLAGAEAGGDRRCDDRQRALFAHLAVAETDDDPARPSLLVTVTVDEGDGQNPVELLASAVGEGRTGWIDAGLSDPVGIPRSLVLAVGGLLTVAAVVVLRRGLGTPSARR